MPVSSTRPSPPSSTRRATASGPKSSVGSTSKCSPSRIGSDAPSGSPVTRRWMGWTVQLVLDQLDHEAQRQVGRGARAVDDPALVPVLQGRLVAVVPVGDHDRLVEHEGGDAPVAVRVPAGPDGVGHPVGVGPLVVGRGIGGQQVGEASGQGQAPDRRQVVPRRPQQVEPVGLGLLGRVLVGEDLAGSGRPQLERADDAGGAAHDTGLVGEGHPVDREGRLVVGDEGPLVLPLLQEPLGDRVAVVAVLVDRQVDAHGVAVVRRQLGPLAVVDHVVGRGGDLGQGDPVAVVAETWERLEAGHRDIVADDVGVPRCCGALGARPRRCHPPRRAARPGCRRGGRPAPGRGRGGGVRDQQRLPRHPRPGGVARGHGDTRRGRGDRCRAGGRQPAPGRRARPRGRRAGAHRGGGGSGLRPRRRRTLRRRDLGPRPPVPLRRPAAAPVSPSGEAPGGS